MTISQAVGGASGRISVVVDTDTGSDDALALVLAARTPGVRLRAVTTVAGNVPVVQAAINAQVTLDRIGAPRVPVYLGRSAPLFRPNQDVGAFHGLNGLGDLALPRPSRAPHTGRAVDALLRIVDEEPGEHVLVTLGPLSNIAAALLVEPAFLTAFTAVYCMVGAYDGIGNMHPVGEFNAWVDPEACRVLLDAPGEKTLIGWDVSRRDAVFTAADQEALGAQGSLGQFALDVMAPAQAYAVAQGLAGFDLPDPLAMAVALEPSLALEVYSAPVSVGLDDAGRGGTFVDHRSLGASRGPGTARIVRRADAPRFRAMMLAACRDPEVDPGSTQVP